MNLLDKSGSVATCSDSTNRINAASTRAAKPDYSLGYIPALDGLRAVSILLVLAFHDIGPVTSQFGHAFNGWIGVDVFFVISGFLITSILLKESQRNNGTFSLRNFYARRWLRIAPAYYAFLAVVLALNFSAGDRHLKPLLAAAFYLTNLDIAHGWHLIPDKLHLSHLWSLGLEEQFYLVWPLCLKLLRHRATVFVLAVIGLAIAWRFCLVIEGATWFRLLHGFDTKVDSIMFGVLTALLLSRGTIQQLARRCLGHSAVQILLSVLTLISFRDIGHPTYYDHAGQLYFWGAKMPMTISLISLCMTSLLSNPGGLVSRALSNPLIVFVGKLSYSLYLWHVLVHMLFCSYYWDYVCKHPQTAELIQYALIFTCACASYFLIEQPFLKLKSYFSTESPSGPVSQDKTSASSAC